MAVVELAMFDRTIVVNKTVSSRQAARRLYAEARKLFNGDELERDYIRGLAILKQAAELGHIPSHEWLGAAYDYGLGTKPDRRLSLKYYMVAAKAGSANAQYHLGVFYRDGIGTRRNVRLAIEWISQAYSQGDGAAAYLLGESYLYGIGVPQNYERAFELELEAANKGILEAQYITGMSYLSGRGVDAELGEALKWLLRAARRGDGDAAVQLSKLYKKRTAEKADQERSEFWLAKSEHLLKRSKWIERRLKSKKKWTDQ